MSAQLKVYTSDHCHSALSDQALKLSFLFARECGFRRLPWMERAFLGLLKTGFEYDLLLILISETSRAPRPSWAYLQAIANRCEANHAFDQVSFYKLPRKDQDCVAGSFHLSADDERRNADLLSQAIADYKPYKEE